MKEDYKSQVIDHLGLVAGMYGELEIGQAIDEAIPQDNEKRIVSIGQCVKAMVLNGLGFVNKQLYLVPMFFENKPVSRLIGEGVKAEHLNDDALGRCLDSLYEYGVSDLFYLISCHSFRNLNLKAEIVHLDSTSFHVDGTYNSKDEPEEGVIHIKKGYSRDHRPDLNQVMLDLIVENKTGIPLLMKPLNGNSSDKNDFVQVIENHIKNLKADLETKYIICDSALYSNKNLKALEPSDIYWISRVPETIKEAKELVRQIPIENIENIDENYCCYGLCSIYGGVSQRWLVIHSEHARKKALKTVNKKSFKQSDRELKAFNKLEKKEFACIPDAEKALKEFEKKLKVTQLGHCSIIEKLKFSKRGRPGKDAQPDKIVYLINGGIASSLEKHKERLQQKSCFIIATNQLDEQELPNNELFEKYKNQNSVEKGFRFLKDPMFLASSFFLKSPERIMALLMVMTICLLVYASLEHRIRTELKAQNKTFPNQKGKPIQNPTARWIFQYFAGIHLLIIKEQNEMVLNLKQNHLLILNLLGNRYHSFYS